MNGSCIVEYDRSKRKWLCISPNGDCAAFDAGKEGKAKAQELAIRYYSEKVAKYLDHLKATHFNKHSLRRAKAGALILASQCVIKPSPHMLEIHPNTLAEIIKKGSDTKYYISKGDKHFLYRCNCQDFYSGDESFKMGPYRYDLDPMGAPHIQGVGVVCKHIWAYHFGSLTGMISKRRSYHDE
jgi:hypothetical protein